MKNISFKDYLQIDAISASDILNFQRTPRDFARQKGLIEGAVQRRTEAMDKGTRIHTMVLEPDEFWFRYVVEPDRDDNGIPVRKEAIDGSMRKTSEGKKFLEEFEKRHQDKQIISSKEMAEISTAVSAIMDNSQASRLLKGAICEASLVWNREGVSCKGRPDAFNNGVLIDLKTTRDLSPEIFEAESYRRKYHQKQAWYLEGLKENGVDISRICLITISNDECIVRDMDSELITRGQEANTRTFNKLREHLDKNEWPSWPEVMPLGIPAWAMVDLNFEGDFS